MAAFRDANATVPAHGAVAVSPNDSTALPVTRALFIGTSGDLSVIMADGGSAVSFVNIANGTLLPIQVTIVRSTGTTASNIVALY